MAVLGYLAKLKMDLGPVSDAHFVHDFSIKMFLISYSINGQSFNADLISFSRYQTNCFIKFLFRQLMVSQTLRFFLDQPLKQWLTGRKRGADENTKT